VLSIDDHAISGIRVVRNPDKLAHIDRQLTASHGRRRASGVWQARMAAGSWSARTF